MKPTKIMTKSFKLLPPSMPNFISYEVPPRPRSDGISFDNKIPVSDLSQQEAKAYSELMAEEFMKHWRKRKDINSFTPSPMKADR